jgi:hypothetical protein
MEEEINGWKELLLKDSSAQNILKVGNLVKDRNPQMWEQLWKWFNEKSDLDKSLPIQSTNLKPLFLSEKIEYLQKEIKGLETEIDISLNNLTLTNFNQTDILINQRMDKLVYLLNLLKLFKKFQ